MSEFCVLGTTAITTQVAAHLDAPIASSAEEAAAAGMPVVVVVENVQQIHHLDQIRQTTEISAVVAWLLPEAALASLLGQNIPVFVGLPDRTKIEEVVDGNIDPEVIREERARTARLAEFERIFTSAPATRR